jgi:hypothetical protein
MNKLRTKIEASILRLEASHRGGGVEITLKPFGFRAEARMSAYQNYLGGGMLGSIQTNHNMFRTSFTTTETKKLERIANELAKYYHEITNEDQDEWSSTSFEQLQNRPASGY